MVIPLIFLSKVLIDHPLDIMRHVIDVKVWIFQCEMDLKWSKMTKIREFKFFYI
jgi:hypothetical protein